MTNFSRGECNLQINVTYEPKEPKPGQLIRYYFNISETIGYYDKSRVDLILETNIPGKNGAIYGAYINGSFYFSKFGITWPKDLERIYLNFTAKPDNLFEQWIDIDLSNNWWNHTFIKKARPYFLTNIFENPTFERLLNRLGK